MDIGVEVSLYPLDAQFIPPIQDFIDRLNRHADLRIVTNSLSTQIFGPYERVWAALQAALVDDTILQDGFDSPLTRDDRHGWARAIDPLDSRAGLAGL